MNDYELYRDQDWVYGPEEEGEFPIVDGVKKVPYLRRRYPEDFWDKAEVKLFLAIERARHPEEDL